MPTPTQEELPAPRLAIVVPCYNEEAVLEDTNRRLTALVAALEAEGAIAAGSRILYVNDGSGDGTWPLICRLHQSSPLVEGLCLAANAGHQNALLAGLRAAAARADAIVTIDADLQDDPEAIRAMLAHYRQGADIVFGVRSDRRSDSLFKRATAQAFYRLMHSLGAATIYNHADYRLMSRRAATALLEYGERNIFLRGIVAQMGYRTATVSYARAPRQAGETKYPLPKMLSFAIDGITSFSVRPLRLILALGAGFIMVALGVAAWIAWCLARGEAVRGWSSLLLSVWFCSGCVLVALSVIGEYVGKIYTETKRRPRYNIDTELRHPG